MHVINVVSQGRWPNLLRAWTSQFFSIQLSCGNRRCLHGIALTCRHWCPWRPCTGSMSSSTSIESDVQVTVDRRRRRKKRVSSSWAALAIFKERVRSSAVSTRLPFSQQRYKWFSQESFLSEVRVVTIPETLEIRQRASSLFNKRHQQDRCRESWALSFFR